MGGRDGEVYKATDTRKTLESFVNIVGKIGSAITAGLFLQEFVPDGASWLHLDIAGPFILEKKWKYYAEGATGFGVKTFVDLAESFA